MKPFKPEFKTVLLAYAAAYACVLAVVLSLLTQLPFPSQVLDQLNLLAVVPITAWFVTRSAAPLWRYLTESYSVDDSSLSISRGWILKHVTVIQRVSVDAAQKVTPALLRLFVGSVVFFTKGGSRYTLHDVKNPFVWT